MFDLFRDWHDLKAITFQGRSGAIVIACNHYLTSDPRTRVILHRQWTSCVAEVPYYFEIPPFFPFTWGYLLLTFDGLACRAEDCDLLRSMHLEKFHAAANATATCQISPKIT